MTAVPPPHLVPETPSDRGFRWMPALPGSWNGRVGAVEELRLCESSLADGPHVAFILRRQGLPGMPNAEESIDLTADDAWKLREQLDWLLEHHYQGDVRPEGNR